MKLVKEHTCRRHLNTRMEDLIYAHPKENIANSLKGVKVTHNGRGGSVKCVICGKLPWWELEYEPV